jgi:hypothetical protein
MMNQSPKKKCLGLLSLMSWYSKLFLLEIGYATTLGAIISCLVLKHHKKESSEISQDENAAMPSTFRQPTLWLMLKSATQSNAPVRLLFIDTT